MNKPHVLERSEDNPHLSVELSGGQAEGEAKQEGGFSLSSFKKMAKSSMRV